MQLPSIDRNPNLRPSGADLASVGANRVMPVAPVNPSVTAQPTIEPVPSVIDMVNPALKKNEGEPVHTSVSDPGRRGSEAATSPKDWTIHRPAPQKAEVPPPKPMYEVLMDHIKSMWTASASAIQLEQVSNQLKPPAAVVPAEVPGNLAKEILVYDPNMIKKNEQI
jgi:hypothetical protein